MTSAKKTQWELMAQMHNLRDAWELIHSDIAFTFHSQAHTKAWARLDRMYLSGIDWCPPTVDIQVDYKWHLSDHFPLILDLQEYDWKSQMKGCHLAHALMVNNLHCGKALFRDYVTQVCLAVNASSCAVTEKW